MRIKTMLREALIIRADFDSKKVRAKSLGLFFGRGTKARTQKNGFGDRYVTITSYP